MANPNSDLLYGLDDKGKPGKVRFRLLLDNRQVWSSDVVTHGAAKEILIELNHAQQITLIVDQQGSKNYDHANWVKAAFWQQAPPRLLAKKVQKNEWQVQQLQKSD